ncbi:peptidylprolyl isomerase [Congregibacter sp.]|nr:peptidylprolyl isomerase [Congregibacter sp.]MDA8961846.1 peptidylprolyl isomerase [Congregibacter sp.]
MMKLTDGLLIAAVALGILIALTGLVDAGKAPLGETTAALVNQTPISADEMQSVLQRRTLEGAPVDQLLDTLDDMIDEELLIQRASELGILRRDSNVRVAIIQAMEKSILNEERGRNFSQAQIQDFYRDNTALFAEPLRLQLEEIVVENETQATALVTALREGLSAKALAAENDDVSITRLPAVPLSLDALGRRYPQDLVSRLETAGKGDILSHESGRGTHIIKILDVREARVPPFDEVRLSVLNELQMHRQNIAYDEYLLWLRQRAEIRKNEQLAH